MPPQKPAERNRAFAALAYLVPLVGGLLALLLDGRSSFTRAHAQQSIGAALALALGFLAWAVFGYALALLPYVGPIAAVALFSLVIALTAFLIANWIVGLALALRGVERAIPLANRIVLRLFGGGMGD